MSSPIYLQSDYIVIFLMFTRDKINFQKKIKKNSFNEFQCYVKRMEITEKSNKKCFEY